MAACFCNAQELRRTLNLISIIVNILIIVAGIQCLLYSSWNLYTIILGAYVVYAHSYPQHV